MLDHYGESVRFRYRDPARRDQHKVVKLDARSSSGVFSCTFCHTASSRSGITGFSEIGADKQISVSADSGYSRYGKSPDQENRKRGKISFSRSWESTSGCVRTAAVAWAALMALHPKEHRRPQPVDKWPNR
jgi:hypothetical protein